MRELQKEEYYTFFRQIIELASEDAPLVKSFIEGRLDLKDLKDRSDKVARRTTILVNKTLFNLIEQLLKLLRKLGVNIRSFNDLVNKLLISFVQSFANGGYIDQVSSKELIIAPQLNLVANPKKLAQLIENMNRPAVQPQTQVEEKKSENNDNLRRIVDESWRIWRTADSIFRNPNIRTEQKLRMLEDKQREFEEKVLSHPFAKSNTIISWHNNTIRDYIDKLRKKIGGLKEYLKQEEEKNE